MEKPIEGFFLLYGFFPLTDIGQVVSSVTCVSMSHHVSAVSLDACVQCHATYRTALVMRSRRLYAWVRRGPPPLGRARLKGEDPGP